jgi:hypothetical protein
MICGMSGKSDERYLQGLSSINKKKVATIDSNFASLYYYDKYSSNVYAR